MRHDKIETTLTYTWILDAELNSMVEQVDGVWRGDEVVRAEKFERRGDDAAEILKKRLAYGEITPNEYRKLLETMLRA